MHQGIGLCRLWGIEAFEQDEQAQECEELAPCACQSWCDEKGKKGYNIPNSGIFWPSYRLQMQ
jgi:hypothetical protein